MGLDHPQNTIMQVYKNKKADQCMICQPNFSAMEFAKKFCLGIYTLMAVLYNLELKTQKNTFQVLPIRFSPMFVDR